MKISGRFAVLISACLPLAIACGSAGNTGFFSEPGGARDPGVAGTESANAGLNEGGASERGGAGGTAFGVAGRPSTGAAGKGSSGSSNSAGGEAMTAGGAGSSASAGTAGIAASAGSASAGKGGTAGMSAGAGAGGTAGASAGAGGSTAGGGGVSGWSGWSGATGSSGAAGASACPASAPFKNTICDVSTPNSCFYAGQACSCLTTTSGPIIPAKRWACYGDGAVCPDTKPTAGASCKPNADAECPYPGNDYCVCSGNNLEAHWVCQTNPPVCAANKPLNDSCSAVKSCSWGADKEVACFCNGSRWGCEGGF